MPHWINQPWQQNLNKTASGKTGAVQSDKRPLLQAYSCGTSILLFNLANKDFHETINQPGVFT